MKFSVASYNIHQCVGIDGRSDPERIATVIRELDAPMIGLQEVAGRENDPDLCQLNYLSKATGMEAIAAPTILRENTSYGNVLLTSCPLLDMRRLDLTFHTQEPRGALEATLLVNDHPVSVVVTHLGLRASERKYQVKTLLDWIGSKNPTILLGDINEWRFLASCLLKINRCFGKPGSPRTFPSRFPLFALDRIWTSPRHALQSVEAHHSPMARIASDHLPVKAIVEL